MATQEQEARTEEAVRAAQSTTSDPAVLAAGGSLLLSLYFYFVRGETERGIFVGLWPPTIFAFVSYFRQTEMSNRLDSALGRNQGMREKVERIIGNQ